MKVAKPDIDAVQEKLSVLERKKKNGCKPRNDGSI